MQNTRPACRTHGLSLQLSANTADATAAAVAASVDAAVSPCSPCRYGHAQLPAGSSYCQVNVPWSVVICNAHLLCRRRLAGGSTRPFSASRLLGCRPALTNFNRSLSGTLRRLSSVSPWLWLVTGRSRHHGPVYDSDTVHRAGGVCRGSGLVRRQHFLRTREAEETVWCVLHRFFCSILWF
jgi:hypothetical protein